MTTQTTAGAVALHTLHSDAEACRARLSVFLASFSLCESSSWSSALPLPLCIIHITILTCPLPLRTLITPSQARLIIPNQSGLSLIDSAPHPLVIHPPHSDSISHPVQFLRIRCSIFLPMSHSSHIHCSLCIESQQTRVSFVRLIYTYTSASLSFFAGFGLPISVRGSNSTFPVSHMASKRLFGRSLNKSIFPICGVQSSVSDRLQVYVWRK